MIQQDTAIALRHGHDELHAILSPVFRCREINLN